MWSFIEESLVSFRKYFSRTAAFSWFCILVIGIIIRSDHLGVTSVIRDLNLAYSCYENLIHFFRSSAFSLDDLVDHWYAYVNSLFCAYLYRNERLVFIIDGVKQSKEGHYMPGVKKLANDSDTQSKPQTMHGHMAGMLSLLIGNAEKMAALPLKMTIQDGVRAMSRWAGSGVSGESHIVQMFQMTSDAVVKFAKPAIVLADRLFLTAAAIEVIIQHNLKNKHKLHLVTKCKKNVVAYMKPEKKKGRGRPRKKGKAIHLNRLFDHVKWFRQKTMTLYGKQTVVRYCCVNLLWGVGRYYELRFVLVAYDNVTSILATTDLTMDPEDVIALYAFRFRIEHLFRSLKQFYGGFAYHFWTKAMPRLNRYKKKGDPDPLTLVTDLKDRARIIAALRATEVYMFICMAAIGINMILSIRYEIDPKNLRYQRTPAKSKPSEENVQYCLRKEFPLFLAKQSESGINRIILSIQHTTVSQS